MDFTTFEVNNDHFLTVVNYSGNQEMIDNYLKVNNPRFAVRKLEDAEAIKGALVYWSVEEQRLYLYTRELCEIIGVDYED